MRYITFTQIDAVTGIPVTQAPARNGPTTPAGARFGFALESRYPLPQGTAPIFYGTILAADDHTAPGILSVITKAEYDAAEAAEMAARKALVIARMSDAVNAERDRRIAGGIAFEGHTFQTDDTSQERIDRSRMSALSAVQSGAQVGDLRWHGVPIDFFWIATDNTRVGMDAQTMVRLGNAVAAQEGLLIVAASNLKARIAAGEVIANVGEDSLWQ